MKKVKYKLKSHNDLDGVAAGILAQLAFGTEVDAGYYSYQNIDKAIARFLEKKENKNTGLYITDISVNEANEKRLQERYSEGKSVCLIDHHVTAEHLNQYDWASVNSVYSDGRKTSATSLFYDYLVKKGYLTRTDSIDEFVELVRLYDTWEWEMLDHKKAQQLNQLFFIVGIEEFQRRMLERLRRDSNEFEFDEVEQTILDLEEEKIERYIKQKQKQILETKIEEYAIGVVHAEQYHSELGNILSKQFPYLDFIVMVNIGAKRLSFRTIHDHIDVAEFATRYDGGGHKKASGAMLSHQAFQEYVVNVFDVLPRKADPDKNKYNLKESMHGTIYENQNGEKYWIHPKEKAWAIHFESSDETWTFDTFEKAENFLKREKIVWLSFDDVFIKDLSERYDVKEATLRSQFERTMEKIKQENPL